MACLRTRWAGHILGEPPRIILLSGGQGNTGLKLSLGVGRLLPEISNKLNVGFGLSVGMYEHKAPAPTSMPGNSFLGPNSLYDKYSLSGGLGLTYSY